MLFLEVVVSKNLVVSAILIAMTAALVHGLVLLAQTVTPPGKYISTFSPRNSLEENRPEA